MSERVTTAVVVGGGIVGLTCALRLQRAGIVTQVFEPDAERRAPSWNNAGHIAIELVEPLSSWKTLRSFPARLFAFGGALDFHATQPGVAAWMLQFAGASSARRFAAGKRALALLLGKSAASWRALVEQLGRPKLFIEQGHTVVWESAVSAKARLAAWTSADIGTTRIHALTSNDLRDLSARCKRPLFGGIRFEQTGHVADPYELPYLLETMFTQAGGVIQRQSVASLVPDRNRAQCVLADGQRVDADLIVICAGARSKSLMRDLGHQVPLIAERGYHIQARADSWPADATPLVFEDRALIVTRFSGLLRACSFVDIADVNAPPDARKWDRLLAHAAELGLPLDASASRWMGARPTLPDFLPAIGRSQRAANVVYAFGHQHLGLTLAPITAEAVEALALGQDSPVSLAAFDVERFS